MNRVVVFVLIAVPGIAQQSEHHGYVNLFDKAMADNAAPKANRKAESKDSGLPTSFATPSIPSNQAIGQGVKVIAPSISTSMFAQEILLRTHTMEVPLRRASKALVVVRSSLFDPLRFSYKSYYDLGKDAENQLNIAGPNYHIYVYSLDDELVPSQQAHYSVPAEN